MSLPSLQSLKGNPLARGKNIETLLVKEESFVKIERSKQTKNQLLIRTTLLVINLTDLITSDFHSWWFDYETDSSFMPRIRKEEKEKD